MTQSEITAIRHHLNRRIEYRLGEVDFARQQGHDDGASSVAYMSEVNTLRGELLFLDDIEAGDAT
jgi:hypothetical protein|tara:strand:- start:1334 stop:1528 length:195 start_codon:yes stop_codon:yes gene_type:complete